MPKTIEIILNFLNGRKTTIMSIIALFITLALTKGWIDNDWAIFYNGVLVALGFSANYGSYKLRQQELKGRHQ